MTCSVVSRAQYKVKSHVTDVGFSLHRSAERAPEYNVRLGYSSAGTDLQQLRQALCSPQHCSRKALSALEMPSLDA